MTVHQKYAALPALAEMFSIPLSSLKIKLHIASKAGIEMPERRRVGRCFLYDTEAFGAWLWENADALRRPAPSIAENAE